MSVDLTASISSGASIASGDSHKPGIKDRLLALKQKANLATGETTDPAYADSFGDPLTDLDGRRRWLLKGLARKIWEPDLCGRLREILRENEGKIHKDGTSKRTATVSHAWMLGYDSTHAHPTVVISSNRTSVLKRTIRIISQHGVLKEAKFVLKGIPFCDLRYRMDPTEGCSGNDESAHEESSQLRHDVRDQFTLSPSPSLDIDERRLQRDSSATRTVNVDEGTRTFESSNANELSIKQGVRREASSEVVPAEFNTDISTQDAPDLRFGAEEITIQRSGFLTTLGGFIMIDDVCFGLTAAHAFTNGDEDDEFGQRSISESDTGIHLYDSDWANDDSSEGEDEMDSSKALRDAPSTQQVQRIKRRYVDGQEYRSETGELRRIAASSRNFSANGLDWALCELGEKGNYALNGVYLPSELRTDENREYLIFKKLETKPPLGKVLVATKSGVISGYGTGSDTSIKLLGDNDYRRVWSVHLEESLTSGDSGSWVVDALTGDVYGMVVAGSSSLQEEYIVPAVDIGQDICRVMRAQSIRLPTWQDVVEYHNRTTEARYSVKPASDNAAIGWESDEDVSDDLWDEDEERFVLAEILKHSSIETEIMVKLLRRAKVQPRWNKVTLPQGRSLRTAQRAVDRLLAGHRPRRKPTKMDRRPSRVEAEQDSEHHSSRDVSSSRENQQNIQFNNRNDIGDETTIPIEEPPELLDSNPNFRTEKSRRAWRARKQAGRGPKPHHRKHNRNRKSGEGRDSDPVLKPSGPTEQTHTTHQRKFEMDSEDEHGNLEPDIILIRHKGSIYSSKFPAFSISDGSLLVGQLRQQVARDFGVDDASRVSLHYRGRSLKTDFRTCQEEGLMMRSEVLCVVKRTPTEELQFLTTKFRAELIPQGLAFMSNVPAEAEKRELEYRRVSETILVQILLKSDAVEVEGDENARTMRKSLVTEVDDFLNDLEIAANKDNPSNWHADFLSTTNARRPSAASPDRPSPSRNLNLRKNDSRDDVELDKEG